MELRKFKSRQNNKALFSSLFPLNPRWGPCLFINELPWCVKHPRLHLSSSSNACNIAPLKNYLTLKWSFIFAHNFRLSTSNIPKRLFFVYLNMDEGESSHEWVYTYETLPLAMRKNQHWFACWTLAIFFYTLPTLHVQLSWRWAFPEKKASPPIKKVESDRRDSTKKFYIHQMKRSFCLEKEIFHQKIFLLDFDSRYEIEWTLG